MGFWKLIAPPLMVLLLVITAILTGAAGYPKKPKGISEVCSFYENGSMKSKCEFAAMDTLVVVDPVEGADSMVIYGPFTFYADYYVNGKPASYCRYKDGMKTWWWDTFDTTGKLLRTDFYENDSLIESRRPWQDGPDK